MVLVEAVSSGRFVVLIADPLDQNDLADTLERIAERRARNYGRPWTSWRPHFG